jgi:hypothetical protein
MPVGGIFTMEDASRDVPVVLVSPSRRSSTAICERSASSIARSMAFSSSRMLPGQL